MSEDIQVKEKTVTSLQIPSLWKVVLLNDDKTPMEFVIDLLTSIFKHNEETAKEITLEIHNTGSAVAGIYPHEIAEQKSFEATAIARAHTFPLQINIEQE
jgi:ATP-dependent Clp protease adaptor protein ClpS